MTDAAAPGVSARLYSQTPYDDRGNFHYRGDLHQPSEPLPLLAKRIERHLSAYFPETSFAIRTEKFAGGRKVIAEILDTPADLTPREAQEALIVAIRDQVERFGFTRSNVLQDFHSCSFFCEVLIGRPYWAALAARRGAENPVQSILQLRNFKRQVKVGDRMKRLHSPWDRSVGDIRTITAVRSVDLIFDGTTHLDFPRAANFACDGRLVRIAIGSEHEPDAHLLYEWLRQEAA